MSPPLLELTSIVKHYHGLRPLRIEHLVLHPQQRVAVVGLDATSAEVLVNLITGVTLPDEGRVALFGRDSAAISDSADWLSLVDRLGIVSTRAVLLDQLTVVQNLAIPFSLDVDPLDEPLRARAIESGREAGLDETEWDRRASEIGPVARLRLRLARALAFDPAVVLFEHPTAELSRGHVSAAAADVRAVLERRNVAGLALTADRDFARAFASNVLTWTAATGRLADERRGWFSRLR